ncbi:MAG: hypothetical protein PVF45_06110 [Anaerolineae bacterium]|jgi:hypothetical protein
MITINCAACGVAFGMPDNLYQKRKEDGRDFCCPNGHNLFFRESENDKLRKRIAELEREVSYWRRDYKYLRGRHDELVDQVRYWQGQARGYKGQWARLRNQTERQALLN